MTTTETTKHGALPLFRGADDCDHPEPPEYMPDWDKWNPAWNEWDADHPYGVEGERLCMLSPLNRTYCPACTEVAADEEDLPIGEYVACREAAATTGATP